MKRHTFNGHAAADYNALAHYPTDWLYPCYVCGLSIGSKLHRRLR